MNAATEYLKAHYERVEEWEGLCGDIANAIEQPGDYVLYVEGEAVSAVGWRYHMVVLRDGMVHDAWCDGEALPPREWLLTMFGSKLHIEVSLNGDTIYDGVTAGFSDDMINNPPPVEDDDPLLERSEDFIHNEEADNGKCPYCHKELTQDGTTIYCIDGCF